LNILTIDVEDYFQVNAFSKYIRYEDWGTYECRIEYNTHRLLEILHTSSLATNPSCPQIKATFFVLGWIAERFSGLVREIQKEGHEIASHGCNHQIVSSMSPEQFREDVRSSKALLEDLTGEAVIGYRASNFSINRQELWALEILAEEGYRYDSSIYPIYHDTYGMPDAPRFPFTIVFNGNGDSPPPSALHPKSYTTSHARTLIEFPLSTVRMFTVNIPVSGGGFFRLFPYGMVKRGLRKIIRKEKVLLFFSFIHGK